MVYAKAFFDLQLQFAHKVMELSGFPFPHVLLAYTNLYIRFGLGRDFHPAHPIWQAYLGGLQDTHDRREWTYRFYLTRAEAMAGPPVVATFGCFSYALWRGDCICHTDARQLRASGLVRLSQPRSHIPVAGISKEIVAHSTRRPRRTPHSRSKCLSPRMCQLHATKVRLSYPTVSKEIAARRAV